MSGVHSGTKKKASSGNISRLLILFCLAAMLLFTLSGCGKSALYGNWTAASSEYNYPEHMVLEKNGSGMVDGIFVYWDASESTLRFESFLVEEEYRFSVSGNRLTLRYVYYDGELGDPVVYQGSGGGSWGTVVILLAAAAGLVVLWRAGVLRRAAAALRRPKGGPRSGTHAAKHTAATVVSNTAAAVSGIAAVGGAVVEAAVSAGKKAGQEAAADRARRRAETSAASAPPAAPERSVTAAPATPPQARPTEYTPRQTASVSTPRRAVAVAERPQTPPARPMVSAEAEPRARHAQNPPAAAVSTRRSAPAESVRTPAPVKQGKSDRGTARLMILLAALIVILALLLIADRTGLFTVGFRKTLVSSTPTPAATSPVYEDEGGDLSEDAIPEWQVGDNSGTAAATAAATAAPTPAPTAAPAATMEPLITSEPAAVRDYLLPDSNVRYLERADLTSLTHEQCALARNEIYARHGRIFLTKEVSDFFRSKSWYRGTVQADQFSSSVFNVYEVYNIDFIMAYEQDTWGGGYVW